MEPGRTTTDAAPTPTPNQPRSGPEQRQAPRRAVRGVRCRVASGARWLWVPAQIVDFSVKGIRLRVPMNWTAGQVRTIRVAAGPLRLELTACCVWSRADGRWTHVIGAAFQGLTPQQEALLAQLLERHGVEPILAAAA